MILKSSKPKYYLLGYDDFNVHKNIPKTRLEIKALEPPDHALGDSLAMCGVFSNGPNLTVLYRLTCRMNTNGCFSNKSHIIDHTSRSLVGIVLTY